MTSVQAVVDEYAVDFDYETQAEKFMTLDRWTGDNPLLLLADAAGTTTGQTYFTHVKPSVEAFQAEFLDTGRVGSFATLAAVDRDDPALTTIFEATRKRRVLTQGAAVLADMPGDDDLSRLQRWARSADPYNHQGDSVGGINGVGLRTFQYLRMIAGIDTVKPDIQVKRFVSAVAETIDSPHLDASSDQAVLRSCEWLAQETDYRLIELDQIAWWHFSEAEERHAKVE